MKSINKLVVIRAKAIIRIQMTKIMKIVRKIRAHKIKIVKARWTVVAMKQPKAQIIRNKQIVKKHKVELAKAVEKLQISKIMIKSSFVKIAKATTILKVCLAKKIIKKIQIIKKFIMK